MRVKEMMFNKEILPCCEYCQFSRTTAAADRLLCRKKGVVPVDYKCKAYEYNPAKRAPRVKPALTVYDKKDFEI